MTRKLKLAGAPLLSLLLLSGVCWDRSHLEQVPGDPKAYHRNVQTAVASAPRTIGELQGEDVPLAAGAVALLKPNAVVSRWYRQPQTGRGVMFLLVQCEDSRDLLGHYPPVCYPGQGWTEQSASRRQWQAGALKIDGTEYRFERVVGEKKIGMFVANFLILPTGQFVPDMSGLTQLSKNRRLRPYGAGQVQVVLDANVSQPDRERIYHDVLSAYEPVFRSILEGIKP